MVVQKTVSLFGTGPYDGVRLNVFIVDKEPTEAMRQTIQSASGIFVYPQQSNLQYFPASLPLISSYAAALTHPHPVTIVENSTPYEFAPKYPHIQVTAPAHSQLHDTMDELERIVVLDIFGIVRRGLVFDYGLEDQLLIIYVKDMTVREVQHCQATGNPHRGDRMAQCWQRQRISQVALCVYDAQTGGVFARLFGITDSREYTQTPGLALSVATRIQNIWDMQSPTGRQ
ncbi:hypothetical protein IWW40_005029 [Coemansia sp. RSA 1250]|nr:hypothetical protein IWW40_005029 [Coemansia sp. RSA 1250]